MNRNSALTSGQLGDATGLSADTIRHYEKLGLLAKALRTPGGYRLYPAESVHRVHTIQNAVKAGFSLAELAGIFKERDAGGAPCRRVAAMAREKLEALDKQIAQLTALRDWLANTVDDWSSQLSGTPPGARARLLESVHLEELPKIHNPKLRRSRQ